MQEGAAVKPGFDKKIIMFVVIVVAAGVLIAFAGFFLSMLSKRDNRQVVIDDQSLTVRVVQTPTDRQRGLSGAKSLAEDQGMLFVFDGDAKHGIWMKEMNFAIDIIWMDKDRKIVHIEKNITPETYPTVFYSSAPSRYVLEVPANYTDRHDIRVGMVASF